jgi:excinuclease ABC subunit C
VHRFAVEYHRKLRVTVQIRSMLDDIAGIGPTRRKALLRHFKSIEAIRDADVESLAAAPSMNTRAAQAVFAFFRQK